MMPPPPPPRWFAVGSAEGAEPDAGMRAAGKALIHDDAKRAARCLPSRQDRPYRVLLLLTDGLSGDQQEIVRDAYGVLGAGVPLVGGCAGDDLKMTRTFDDSGFCTYGEIARARGMRGFHNQTLVVVSIS